jgi:hypothetical protein
VGWAEHQKEARKKGFGVSTVIKNSKVVHTTIQLRSAFLRPLVVVDGHPTPKLLLWLGKAERFDTAAFVRFAAVSVTFCLGVASELGLLRVRACCVCGRGRGGGVASG